MNNIFTKNNIKDTVTYITCFEEGIMWLKISKGCLIYIYAGLRDSRRHYFSDKDMYDMIYSVFRDIYCIMKGDKGSDIWRFYLTNKEYVGY